MELLERARRLAHLPHRASVLDALRAGESPAAVAAAQGIPLARVQGVASFYELLHPTTLPRACVGTACWSARPAPLPPDAPFLRCLGRCYEAPCAEGEVGRPIPVSTLVDPPVVFADLNAPIDVNALYALPAPSEILARVVASGLRGRGGAAFPTGAKWSAAARQPGPRKYVVANGDEGDPGSFVDRLLLEAAPHRVLAGLKAAAVAIGADHGIVYIRGEYPAAADRMEEALAEARAAGLLPNLTIEVRRGAGSYVVGEETALLRAIEGLRGESSPKPPYPAERGLHGCPTVVQNVETLCVVPHILHSGAAVTTKAFSLSGAIARPGAVEAPFGIPLSILLDRGGGGPAPGRRWKMALIGGPMGTVLPASRFDTPLDPATLPGLGHGGIVVLDDTVSAGALARHLYDFAAGESCGACTPCRVGTRQLAKARNPIELQRLLRTLEMGSLCGFGQGVPRPLRDLAAQWPDELFAVAP